MTKSQFIASVEAKPNFIKWLGAETIAESIGGVNKIFRSALVSTSEGFTNIFQVWYIEDTATGETTFQNVDTLTPTENAAAKKQAALEAYLTSTFSAFRILWSDTDRNWAEAEAFAVSGQDLVRSKVLVFKIGNNPITHRVITN